MKTFEALNDQEKAAALAHATENLLLAICEGRYRFNDALNGDNLQSRIDAAWQKAERNRTPWFIGEFIMDTCREEIEGMAQCDAEDSLYAEPDEFVVPGVAGAHAKVSA